MNISHQQSSKENMKTSVKTQEIHLKKREMEVCRKFLQDESLMKMRAMRRKRIGKGGEISEVDPFSSLPSGLNKEKRRVKIIYFDFGEK